jgi:PKD repeat protein
MNQRPGPAASVTQNVPDLTAPVGTFTVSWVDRTGTITQTSLTDDGPVGQITRTVSWGDGTAAQAWNGGTTINHLYAADGLYRPTVTLKDADGNTRVVNLPAIVPGDKTAPVGTFTTTPAKAWQVLTTVSVTQTSLSDDFSAAADVLRWVNWGDGSAVEAWTTSVSATHVYAAAGVYTPEVVLKDDAGNTRAVAAQAVTVEAYTVVPVVKLVVPKKGVADEVGSWKKLLGHATDDKGTGVASVSVLAIEKRATGWYFFKATSKTWVKAATKGKAWKRAKAAVVVPTAKGDWAVRLTGLRKGTLFVRASAADVAGNVSKPVSKKAVLTAS